MKKIVLFTPYPPTMGGGGQNLRGAIPHLKDVDITWAYLSYKEIGQPALDKAGVKQAAYLGVPVLGGSLFSSIKRFWELSSSKAADSALIKPTVDKLLAMNADRYWIIAHYEGMAIAEALMAAGKSVHISVHDDPAALCGRSRRYFWATRRVMSQLQRILTKAPTCDVTSHPMGERYKKLWGVNSVAYFPYVPALPEYTAPPVDVPFRVGYAGSLYSPKEPKVFARALKILEGRLERPVEWHLWGLNAVQASWVENLAVPTTVHPFCVESELLEQLQNVHLLYVMYPFDRKSIIFRQTSHPAKLSTYLKAQRPIFAQAQTPASLIDFLLDTSIGAASDARDAKGLAKALERFLMADIPASAYANARERWYGENNLKRLNEALLNNS